LLLLLLLLLCVMCDRQAALNMMTCTMAADYARDNVYINSVDTGWVTNEHAWGKEGWDDFTPPLDDIDGAARILQPVPALAHFIFHLNLFPLPSPYTICNLNLHRSLMALRGATSCRASSSRTTRSPLGNDDEAPGSHLGLYTRK
jgi:hypothetical protein